MGSLGHGLDGKSVYMSYTQLLRDGFTKFDRCLWFRSIPSVREGFNALFGADGFACFLRHRFSGTSLESQAHAANSAILMVDTPFHRKKLHKKLFAGWMGSCDLLAT